MRKHAKMTQAESECAWNLYEAHWPIPDIAEALKRPVETIQLHTRVRERGFTPGGYLLDLAHQRGYPDYNAVHEAMAKGQGYENSQAYRKAIIQERGHRNESTYKETLAQRAGFASRTAYSNFIAQKKGHKNHYEYLESLTEAREKCPEMQAIKRALTGYLRETGQTYVDFGRVLGVTPNMARRYCLGKTRPRPAMQEKIMNVTGVTFPIKAH